jgi:hypothetical protein
MSKHEQNKKALEDALGLKFFQGRNADWGATYIMSIKGNEYTGLFICDLEPLTGENKIVLMVRVQDPVTGGYEDTDIETFCSDTDNIEYFIEKLNWV